MQMADPYEFLVRESKVSSSQEDVLQHIPGWEEREEPACSPLEAELPLSRLCGASSSDNEGERAFGLKGPLELTSPDTQALEEDSFNPAFESDRDGSLSPCAVFGGIWGSRLITQSQDAVRDIHRLVATSSLELHGIVRKGKGMASCLETAYAAEEHNKKQRTSLQQMGKESRQTKDSEFSGFGNWAGILRESVVPQSPHGGAESKKTKSTVDILDCCDNPENDGCSTEGQFGEAVAKQASHKIPEKVALNVEIGQSRLLVNKTLLDGDGLANSSSKNVTNILRSSALTEGLTTAINNKSPNSHDGESEEGDLLKGLKCLIEGSHPQEENNQQVGASDARSKDPKAIQSKTTTGEPFKAGTRASKRVLPAVMSSKDRSLVKRGEVEVEELSKTKHADHLSFPESVMDVVMLVSGVLLNPGPDEPDLLSAVMATGVSLPLPIRNCNGDLLHRKDHSMLK